LTLQEESGSAVAIRIGDRFFLATAAHLLKERHEFIVPRRSPDENCLRSSDFLSRHCNDDADVGLLEIDPGKAQKIVDRFLPGERLLLSIPLDRKLGAVIIGYSTDCLSVTRQPGKMPNFELVEKGYAALVFATETVPHDEWPSERLERPLKRGRDILLSYGQAPFITFEEPGQKISGPSKPSSGAPTIKGCSGGGIWVYFCIPSPVWRPCAKLIGLQVSYYRGPGWARGTAIGVWLDLLSRKYPDLRKEIENIHNPVARPVGSSPE
jgi:hypothetical protein